MRYFNNCLHTVKFFLFTSVTEDSHLYMSSFKKYVDSFIFFIHISMEWWNKKIPLDARITEKNNVWAYVFSTFLSLRDLSVKLVRKFLRLTTVEIMFIFTSRSIYPLFETVEACLRSQRITQTSKKNYRNTISMIR